jgi:spoIIIJ-associated protein
MKFLDRLLKRGSEDSAKKTAEPIKKEVTAEEKTIFGGHQVVFKEKTIEPVAPLPELFTEPPIDNENAVSIDITALEDTAKNFVADFLRLFGSDAEVESVITEPIDGISREKTEIKIDLTAGSSPGRLIGKHGETLDALQRVISAVVNRRNKDDFIRIRLDVDGYRTKREIQLRDMAQRAADRAKKIHRPVSLEPMNSYERHIIHEALQNISGISTRSSGTEPNRHIVVSFNRGGHYDANR